MAQAKQKTHRGASKRFACKKLRVKRGTANGRHILTKQSGKKKRQRLLTVHTSGPVKRLIKVLLKKRNAN